MTTRKKVCGVGINDSTDKLSRYEKVGGKQVLVWVCPIYRKWKDMLSRCYVEKNLIAYPKYRGCSVCEEWLTFSKFKAWMETQDWEDKHLDKDILFPGNKIYSPEACVFVEPALNIFLTDHEAKRGEYPIGVSYYRNKDNFASHCCINGRQKLLGYFDTPEEAHLAWKKKKLELAILWAEKQTDARISKALIERYK